MVSEESTCTVLLRARCLLLLLLLAADSKERRCSVCGITFKITSNMERKQKNDLGQSEHERIPPHPKHTHSKKHLFIYGNFPYGPASWTTRKVIRRTWRLCTHRTPTYLLAGIEGVRTYAFISLLHISTAVGCLASNGDWRSRSLKKHLKFERTRMDGTGLSRRELATLLINQLMTPYFSGGSTLSGTPGGDRWAGVLGGQIGWLSECLHPVDADCCLGLSQPSIVYSCTNLKNKWGYLKNKEKSRPTENTPRNPHQPSDRDHLGADRDETRPTR